MSPSLLRCEPHLGTQPVGSHLETCRRPEHEAVESMLACCLQALTLPSFPTPKLCTLEVCKGGREGGWEGGREGTATRRRAGGKEGGTMSSMWHTPRTGSDWGDNSCSAAVGQARALCCDPPWQCSGPYKTCTRQLQDNYKTTHKTTH